MRNREISGVDRVALAAIFAASTLISFVYGFTASAAPPPEMVASAALATPSSKPVDGADRDVLAPRCAKGR